ncbi:hypothetical protein, partial [Klebsiella pneumoniae]|uniref:hypothetical protein n=1 Tax=Klebsiella pneumoniae TaxID=573 RepID=UPI0025A03F87
SIGLNRGSDGEIDASMPLQLDASRLDVGRLPIFASTHTFLDGFSSLLDNDGVRQFFARANAVEFTADGMSVTFGKGSGSAFVPSAPAA